MVLFNVCGSQTVIAVTVNGILTVNETSRDENGQNMFNRRCLIDIKREEWTYPKYDTKGVSILHDTGCKCWPKY